MSDRSQSKVPIFVFVVGAILLGAAALLSVLVTVPSPGGRTPPAVTADEGSPPKTGAAADKVEARLPAAKPAPSAVTEPVNTGALAGPGPGHTFEPPKDDTSSPSAAISTGEPAAAEPMSDADLAEIKAATRAAAEVAAAEAPSVRPNDDGQHPGAEAETSDPIMTAAAPHAADADEPETSAAEPHAPASLSGATAPPAKAKAEDAMTRDQAPGPGPTANAKAEPSQPTPTPAPARAANDRNAAAPTPAAGTTTEPASTRPALPEDSKPEPVPPAKTAEITHPQAAASEPEHASPMPVETEPPPPMPSKKVVEAAPEVPEPTTAEAPTPVKAASEDKSDDRREPARSRQAEAAQPAASRQAETKPGARPMTLGFGLLKPKTAPAPHARGKGSRAYGAVVRGAVGRHKPRGVGRGRVTVTFSIGPMGALRGVSVARSSGNSKLDQAAVAAVRSAAPFPAPPSGAGQTYSLPIYFH